MQMICTFIFIWQIYLYAGHNLNFSSEVWQTKWKQKFLVTHSADHYTNLELHTLDSLKHNDEHELQSNSQNGHHNSNMSC